MAILRHRVTAIAHPGASAVREPGDISLAPEVLGYSPKYDLPEAIRNYAAWCERRQESRYKG